MIVLVLTALAGQKTCEYRGVPLDVSWDATGHITVQDGAETVVTVELGALSGTVVGSCREDGLRLIADEETGRLTVTTFQLDFGPNFDADPGRFRAERVQTLAAMKAVGARDWPAVARALAAGAKEGEVLEATLRATASDPALLEAARAALPANPALDLALARAHFAAGRLDEARALVAADSVLAGEILWAEGERGAARRIWTEAAARGVVLPEGVRGHCPRCAPTP